PGARSRRGWPRGPGGRALRLWRDVPVLLLRVGVALAGERAQRGDEPRSRLVRLDDVVQVAPRGRGVRVRVERGVLRRELGAPLLRILGPGQLVLVQDVHRALGAHDRDLGRGPRDVVVAADVLARHDVIGPAVGLAGDDGELGHRRLGIRVEELRAVADDAAVLLRRAGQEAGD